MTPDKIETTSSDLNFFIQGWKEIDGVLTCVRIPVSLSSLIQSQVSTQTGYTKVVISPDYDEHVIDCGNNGVLHVYHIVLATLGNGADVIQVCNISDGKALQPTAYDTRFLHVAGYNRIRIYCENPTQSTLVLYKELGSHEIPEIPN